MERQTRAIARIYRGEAALLAAQAAARLAPPPPPAPPPEPVRAAPAAPYVELPKPDRPPLEPEPATNQNIVAAPPPPRRRSSTPRLGRRLAWVVLAPWYAVMVVASFGVPVLFAKSLLGL